MKKIDILVIIVVVLLISLPITNSIIKENKRKAVIADYAFTISTLTNKTKEMIQYVGYQKEVSCSNITTNEIVLNECTVNNSKKKYCYIDTFYDCEDKNYQLSYQKALLAEIPKKYNAGDLVKIDINNEKYDFYVLKDKENEITAISAINLPLLDNTRLPNINDIYPNIKENWQEDYIQLLEDIKKGDCLDCDDRIKEYQLPDYLINVSKGYKLAVNSEKTWYINNDGLMYGENEELETRTIITISKDKIVK